MNLSDLRPAEGSKRKPKRVGCGIGSGNGKTAGRGTKGYGSRSGSSIRPGFEGGQMPLFRRLPKRGFTNINSRNLVGINLDLLAAVFEDGAVITEDAVLEAGLVKNPRDGIKILGNGELNKKFTVSGMAVSEGAKNKIEAAGGKVEA